MSKITKCWILCDRFLRSLRKTADISRRQNWFPHAMKMSEERTEKFQTGDLSLSRSGLCFWLVLLRRKFALTNQKHYSYLGSDTSSVWNFSVLSAGKPVLTSWNVGCFLRLVFTPYIKCFKSAILQTSMSLPAEAVFKFPICIGLELLGFVVIS